ncbi:MAG: tetratricopeptide repeat protein [Planctomycetes bacterium]|nr:tetratricopeptide repeat protein [Planctomycetota bacterium]
MADLAKRSVFVSAYCLTALTLALASAGAVLAEESSNAAKLKFSAAAELQNEGQFGLAIDEYREFLKQFEKDPLAAKARHYLGVCLIQEKKYPEAVETLQAVVEKHPGFELLDDTYLNLGSAQYNVAVAGGKPEGFAAPAKTYGTLIEKYPDSKLLPLALFNHGESLYASGDKAAAAVAYAKFLEKFPQHRLRADALYALGLTQLELKKPDAAGATLAKFAKEFPDHKLATKVVMHQADALFEQGKFSEAEPLFAKTAGAKDFDQADRATVRQADCLTMLKKYAEAAALLAAVPTKFPKSNFVKEVPLLAGNRYYLAGDLPSAVKWLKQSVEAGGGDAPQAAHWLARAYLDQKKPAEALAVTEKIIPQAKNSEYLVELKIDQADAAFDVPERRKDAVALYAAAAKEHAKHPRAAQAQYNAAWAALNVGDHAAALQHATAFLEQYGANDLAISAKAIQADSLLNTDKASEAIKAYRELIEKNPKHSDREQWQVLLGWALRRDQKYTDVIALLEPLAPKLNSTERQGEAFYLIGASRYAEKQYPAARDALTLSLKANPKWTQADEVLLLLARSQRQLDDLKGAETTLRKVLKEMPQSSALDRAHYHLGELLYASKDYKQAAAEYELVLKEWPKSSVAPAALYWLGWSRLLEGDHAKSVAALTQLIEKNSGDELAAPAHFARAKALRLQGKNKEAIADIAVFINSKPSREEKSAALLERGLAEMELKQHAEAVKTFDALMAEDAKYAAADRVLYNLAWAQKELKHDAEAVAAFNRLAKEHAASPFAGEALYHVAEADYQQKKYDEAATAYAAALKLCTASKQKEIAEMAAHKLAWCHYHRKQYDEAQQAFAEQLKDFPQGELVADAAFMEAESLMKLEKFADAAKAYEAVLKSPPKSAEFQALATLHAAQAAAQQKKWDTALKLSEQGLDKFPDSQHKPEMLYEQAWALQNKDDLDGAAKIYEQVTSLTGREVGARARLMLGEIKFEKGDHTAAIRDFFKVFRTDYRDAPESYNPWKAQAMYESARCFEVLKKPDQALKYYQELLTAYPKSSWATTAQQRIKALSSAK